MVYLKIWERIHFLYLIQIFFFCGIKYVHYPGRPRIRDTLYNVDQINISKVGRLKKDTTNNG